MTLVLDRYEILRRLAVGGMGEVFLAVQRGAGGVQRLVILKSMLPDLAREPTAVRAFLDEARVIATLNHPNVVALYEVTEWQGLPLIAMEFVRGRTVAELHRRCLRHAHQARDVSGQPLHLVHRDISPQNIMVRTDGVSKVLDFGIAHTALNSVRTATGLVKGKLAYMAPEQARGERLDHRVDQCALGVVLWELLTHHRLFTGEHELDLLKRVMEPVVAPPRSRERGQAPRPRPVRPGLIASQRSRGRCSSYCPQGRWGYGPSGVRSRGSSTRRGSS